MRSARERQCNYLARAWVFQVQRTDGMPADAKSNQPSPRLTHENEGQSTKDRPAVLTAQTVGPGFSQI